MKKLLLVFACLWAWQGIANAQEVMQLTFAEAKQTLVKNNLGLLAAYYDVSIAEADLIQAKVWNNPYLIWNQDLYSNERNDYFNFRNQYLIQIEQVFSVAGKHTNTVKMAKLNVAMNKIMLEDVLRSLIYELADSYADLYALQQKAALLETTYQQYLQIVQAAKQQQRVGTLAGNEVIRLESEAIALQADALANSYALEQAMAQLRKLLNLAETARIQTQEYKPQNLLLPNLAGLVAEAKATRPDFRLAEQQIEYQKRNLRLQRSLAVPDIKFAYQPSDKGSNYVRTYSGFNIEMPIPLFDRNQGRIQGAKVKVEQSNIEFQQLENELRNDVITAYNQFSQIRDGLVRYDTVFLRSLEELRNNANTNYNRRNISLLEFIDQQRIYIRTQTQLIDLSNNYFKAINRLHFSIGKEIIN